MTGCAGVTSERCRASVAYAMPSPYTAVRDVLHSGGRPLDTRSRAHMDARFGHDFSRVRVHTGARAADSARAVGAMAYTVGRDIVFGDERYAPGTSAGDDLLAHELAHVIQQGDARDRARADFTGDSASHEGNADAMARAALSGAPIGPVLSTAPTLQRRPEPYIKKITVHLKPDQTADLEWKGTAPADAPGKDSFTVSTGKGYGDRGDPPGTCTRQCCADKDTQCAPPWNRPDRIGACCTFFGSGFWTGTPEENHGGWLWWTPIQPHYANRGIALHQHGDVTGKPISHGCVRMEEENARRIHDFSNGRRTSVTIDGRAAPVGCEADRKCGASGTRGPLDGDDEGARMVESPVPRREGEMS
jgi:hypothetical protein